MNDMLRILRDNEERLKQTETRETFALRPPFTAISLVPVAVTSTIGAFPQDRTITVLAFRCAIFVATTNNATNFWTVALITTAGVVIASFTTAAIAANTWTRFAVTTGITQPGAANVAMLVTATTTLAPGAIYVIPEVQLLEQT